MIHSVAYDGYVEISIVGDIWAEFEHDLIHFRRTISPRDREYLAYRNIWKVTNLEKYARAPFIQKALLSREKQMELFQSDVGKDTP